ncbi:hypothetical protein [Burkholderia vietnamiensis]|uniref:hypothetical protein n=1 Tax=Burkholderia vietnamiensis TaxID=60552 RepID=UPI001D1534C5|nr:hypothetical protein [Burkholderia vietnamiensis]UEC05494.1 hypothetical protein LK462_35390 [Burkholderia vietnamiensis]
MKSRTDIEVPDYPLTAEMLDAMLRVTRIENENMRMALHDHLVLGEPQAMAAVRYGYSKQQLGVHVKAIREKVKPAFDTYAALTRALKKRP